MSIHDKILDAVEAVKWKLEDLVFTAKNKILDVVDYVKYDVLKKDLPKFNLDLDEEKPKKSKKKKTKKKKK